MRIWDAFFIEGHKVIYRTALGIFKMNENELINMELEDVFEHIKGFIRTCSPDALMKASHKIIFSRKKLEELEKEYHESPDLELLKLCTMH